MEDGCLDGHPHDALVKLDTPMFNIPNVAFYPFLHLPQFLRFTTESCHLRPASDTRLHKVAHHILGNLLFVEFRMVQHVGSRTDHRHIPLQHVPELRQFVDVVFPHSIPERKLSLLLVLLVVIIELGGQCRELIVIDHHCNPFGTVLLDERLDDGKGLTRAWCSDHPCATERGTWVLFNVLIIS